MTDLFLQIVNMSITASYIALAVILLRLLLKKSPKWIIGILWGFVGLRLIFPFSFESVFSLIPSAKPLPDDILISETPSINSGISFLNERVNPILQGSFSPNTADSVNPLLVLGFIAAVIWLLGIAVMLIYTAVSFIKIKLKVKEAVIIRDNIYETDRIQMPFILGVIKPKIYLPFAMNGADRELVILHEKAHLKRLDHIWKPLGFLLLSVYWFNPVLWVAYILLCRDIELACDEKVIKEKGTDIKRPYSEALINCSVSRKMISACPLAFGEVGVKARIKSVLNYKKPAFWVIALAVISIIITAVCLLTNPKGGKLSSIGGLTIKAEYYVSLWYGDGESYRQNENFKQKDLEAFLNLRISKTEVSGNRGDDRDKSNVIVLRSEADTTPSISSYLEGTYFCFNDDFTEVWLYDSFKPTLSYRVLNPEKAKEAFFRLCNRNGIDFRLKDFLDDETKKYTTSEMPDNSYFAVDYEIMEMTETETEITLYMWVYDGVYTFNNGRLAKDTGGHIFHIVTAAKNGNEYTLKEYWKPDDGSEHARSIREKVPFHLWYKALNSQLYADKQRQRCEQAALRYFTQNDQISHDIESIVDESKNNPDASFDTAEEEFYRDSEYIYYFSVIKSQYIIVTYTDGTTQTVDNALESGRATLFDLDRFGIEYKKKKIDGVVKFYTEATKEDKSPTSSLTDKIDNADLVLIIKELKSASWSNDALINRAPYKFEGMLFYEKEIYFNLSESFAYCDGNIAKLPENTLKILLLYKEYDFYYANFDSRNYYDLIDFDIDGDGEKEQCNLNFGPTSGLFTFSFIVTERDKSTEFYNTFMIDHSALFFKIIDGKLKIEAITRDSLNGSIKSSLFDVSVKDGNIVLTNNGQEADYWGEQGKHPLSDYIK